MRRSRSEERAKRRAKVRAYIDEHLGTACVECGATSNLEAAHIDRDTKRFSLAKAHMYRWSLVVAEVAKCRRLCRPCHASESSTNQDHLPLSPEARALRIYSGSKGKNRSVQAC